MHNQNEIIDSMLKLFIIIALPLTIVFGLLSIMSAKLTASQLSSEPTVLLRTPLTEKNWTDLGSVVDPVINLSVKTLSGFEKMDFVLDSGAVISSLPREWAEKIGSDLAFAKRISFKGFGNTLSFAYQSDMVVKLNNENVQLPIVFTESEGTRALIGRKGFFDNYSILFDHTEKVMEIRK